MPNVPNRDAHRPVAAINPVWWELRQREEAAAAVGGRKWMRFVNECECRLALPWRVIRVEFDRIPVVRHV